MGRRPLNRLELRAEAEAAEALGLNTPPARKPRAEPTERRPKPAPRRGCGSSGRSATSAAGPSRRSITRSKADAEALAAALKAKGKGDHFVRSLKEPMDFGPSPSAPLG